MRRYTYVLILAHGGPRDTINCLHSALASGRDDIRVVLCDNASPDDTVDRVLEWAASTEPAMADNELPVELPAVARPVSVVRYTRAQAEAGGDTESDAVLTVIDVGANLGCPRGTNVGLRYISARGDARFAWLFNNDAVAAPGALEALEAEMEERPQLGLCGSTILDYRDPDRVQLLGGLHYYPAVGFSTRLGRNMRADALPDQSAIERRMSFVYGTSIMIRGEALDSVGIFTEEVFLYHEELDLALRTKQQYEIGWAPESVVYHKGGTTIGSHGGFADRSAFSNYHLTLTRMWVTRKHYQWAFVTVYLAQWALAASYGLRGRGSVARAVISAAHNKPLSAR